MSNLNHDEYEKYIRFYLDLSLNEHVDTNIFKYQDNPNKEFIKYIVNYSSDKAYTFSFPMSVFWNLTSACNLRCKHCLYNKTGYNSTNDLSTMQANKLANELIKMGVTYVILSGGEVFLRPDAMKIIKKLKNQNIAVRILTNAMLLENAQIDELARLFNPYTDAVSISLDAAKKETLQEIRQTENFEKIINNIRKLVERNVRVDAVCTVNNINYNEIADIYRLSEKLKVHSFIVGKMIAYNKTHEQLIVSNQQLFELYYKLTNLEKSDATKLVTDFWPPIELLNIPEVRKIIEEPKYQSLIQKNYTKVQRRICHHHDRLAIKADGTVYLCPEAIAKDIAPLGNYKNHSMTKIWKNRLNNPLFLETRIDDMACNKCKYNCYCNSGCIVKTSKEPSGLNNFWQPSCSIASLL